MNQIQSQPNKTQQESETAQTPPSCPNHNTKKTAWLFTRSKAVIALICAAIVLQCGCTACSNVTTHQQSGTSNPDGITDSGNSTTANMTTASKNTEAVSQGAAQNSSQKTKQNAAQTTNQNAALTAASSSHTNAKPGGTTAASKLPNQSANRPATTTTTKALTPIEKIAHAINLWNTLSCTSKMSGTTALSIGGSQSTSATRTVKRGNALSVSYAYQSKSKWVSINDSVTGDGANYSYIKDNGAAKTYSKADYIKTFGPVPERHLPYLIEANTATVTASGNTYTVVLDPNTGAEEYKTALQVNASRGGASFKSLDSVKLTITLDDNGRIAKATVHEVYQMKMIITVKCTSDFNYTFTY